MYTYIDKCINTFRGVLNPENLLLNTVMRRCTVRTEDIRTQCDSVDSRKNRKRHGVHNNGV